MGWPPRKRQPRGKPGVQGRDDRLLGAAGVGDERPLGAMLGGLADMLDDAGRPACKR